MVVYYGKARKFSCGQPGIGAFAAVMLVIRYLLPVSMAAQIAVEVAERLQANYHSTSRPPLVVDGAACRLAANKVPFSRLQHRNSP